MSFKVGDLVALRSDPSIIVPIIEVAAGSGEARYWVFEAGQRRAYYEQQLQSAEDSASHHPIAVDDLRARLTSWQVLARSTTSLYSLRSGRVQFVPYQYRPVLKLIKADQPRLLIADEVGVGKTIETGLIIKELRARLDIKSILVICPKALVAEKKWFTEMKRFDEHFMALDGAALRHCLSETDLEGEWPDTYRKAIVPFSLFDSDLLLGTSVTGRRKSLGLLELDPPPQFDLVIVDEAHHIRNPETFLHQGVRAFCDNAKAVVLLTATPVQLGSNDLFTLLNVLRPDLIIDEASFEQRAAPNGYINAAIHECRLAKSGWEGRAESALGQAGRTDWGQLFLESAPEFQDALQTLQSDGSFADETRVPLIRQLEELYTFSPMINRTRRRDIGEFTTRKPETVLVEFTDGQRDVHDALLDIVARILARLHGNQNVKFMMTTIRRQGASSLYGLAPLLRDLLHGKIDQLELLEAVDSDDDVDTSFVDQIRGEVRELIDAIDELDGEDPKVEAFKEIISDKGQLENNKCLVFTTFRHTLAYLEEHANGTGLRVGVVHGGIGDEERFDLRRRFALPKTEPHAIDVLLSSEVGCEGLDFQFCDMIVNYDLPWNPMRIEQRIGRIDRYGQTSETVAIINLVTPGTVDADIYQRCLFRIGVFHHAIGGSEEILGEITHEIHAIADSFTLTEEEREARLNQLSDNHIRRVREEEELESKQADLLGLNVPKAGWQSEIDDAETYWLSPAALEGMVERYLSERLKSERERVLGSGTAKTLRLNQEERAILMSDFGKRRGAEPIEREWEKWLKGHSPTLPVTFDQETAANERAIVHLSVLHPLVRQAARHLGSDAPQYCSVAVQSDDLPAGVHPFAIYRWAKHGLRDDETLVSVADDREIEAALLELLPSAADSPCELPNAEIFDALDARHHGIWVEAQSDHREANRRLVEHRIQSLRVSHEARVRVIENQIAHSTNAKIQTMRRGELARAQLDFDGRMRELDQAGGSGDIRANPMVFGLLEVRGNQA